MEGIMPSIFKEIFKMTCNCINNDNVIQFVKGTTVNLSFDFDEDIRSYTSAEFVIRKDYETSVILDKTVIIEDENIINITLTPTDTNVFNEFLNGKNSAKYIWGLDLIDSDEGIRVNVFPQTGEPAPLCIVYKHV